jgi:hypothetical protein
MACKENGGHLKFSLPPRTSPNFDHKDFGFPSTKSNGFFTKDQLDVPHTQNFGI